MNDKKYDIPDSNKTNRKNPSQTEPREKKWAVWLSSFLKSQKFPWMAGA